MKKRFKIKSPDNSIEDMLIVSPKLFIVWGYFLLFAEKRNLPATITNIKHKFKTSVSNTHPTGRAIDVSVRGWSDDDIDDCVEFLEDNVNHLGAVSKKTRQPRVVYYHETHDLDGNSMGKHFHLQVSH